MLYFYHIFIVPEKQRAGNCSAIANNINNAEDISSAEIYENSAKDRESEATLNLPLNQQRAIGSSPNDTNALQKYKNDNLPPYQGVHVSEVDNMPFQMYVDDLQNMSAIKGEESYV